jgi:hypothetical protein
MPINVMLTLPPLPNGYGKNLEEAQASWIEKAVMMCLAKERVVGVYCTNWSDEAASADESMAMVNSQGIAREPLKRLQKLQDEYWA